MPSTRNLDNLFDYYERNYQNGCQNTHCAQVADDVTVFSPQIGLGDDTCRIGEPLTNITNVVLVILTAGCTRGAGAGTRGTRTTFRGSRTRSCDDRLCCAF